MNFEIGDIITNGFHIVQVVATNNKFVSWPESFLRLNAFCLIIPNTKVIFEYDKAYLVKHGDDVRDNELGDNFIKIGSVNETF